MIGNHPQKKKVVQIYQSSSCGSGDDMIEDEDGRTWRSLGSNNGFPCASGERRGTLHINGKRTNKHYYTNE